MALTNKDLDSIRSLLQLELKPLKEEMYRHFDGRFDNIANQIDGLYHSNEKRKQEYVALKGQMSRIEKRVDALEKRQS
jgi:FtsZ-binding cell division protein ZapB